MATDKRKAAYLKKMIKVARKLNEKGFEAGFGKSGDRVDHGLPQPYSEVCREPVFEMEGKQVFGDEIMAGDAVYMVGNNTGMLKDCDQMETASGTRKIFKREPFAPDGETIIFTWLLLRE